MNSDDDSDTKSITQRILSKKRKIEKTAQDMEDVVQDMDEKLNTVIKRHEKEYLKGYSIFIREKETELRGLIQKLNDRNNDSTLKDEIIFGLK